MKRLVLLLAAGALAACPEERGAIRRQQVPAARVPAAVPVEATPATAPAESPPATTSGR